MRLIDGDALKIAIDDGWLPDMMVSEIWEVIDNAPSIVGWISVEDRLPDTKLKREKWVLVSLVNNNNGHRWETPVVAEYVTRDKEWFFAGCDIDDVTVTHWTHLPEPPKEVGGDE